MKVFKQGLTARRAKSAYKVDLVALLAECESNYVRLLKLMPDFEHSDRRSIGVGTPEIRVDIDVIERLPYTTTVKLSQPRGDWLSQPALTVRLYHDAAMAEVIQHENMKQLRGRYSYPNPQMHQRDEKMQLNKFLGEWLTNCLRHGFARESGFLPVY